MHLRGAPSLGEGGRWSSAPFPAVVPAKEASAAPLSFTLAATPGCALDFAARLRLGASAAALEPCRARSRAPVGRFFARVAGLASG